IYERIHRALCGVLARHGGVPELVGTLRCGVRTAQRAVPTNNCFANPVRADVMIESRKIAGGAQRRTRRGLLQQGSIQGITVRTDLAQEFAQALSVDCSEFKINEEILKRARELAQQKYGTDSWLRKR